MRLSCGEVHGTVTLESRSIGDWGLCRPYVPRWTCASRNTKTAGFPILSESVPAHGATCEHERGGRGGRVRRSHLARAQEAIRQLEPSAKRNLDVHLGCGAVPRRGGDATHMYVCMITDGRQRFAVETVMRSCEDLAMLASADGPLRDYRSRSARRTAAHRTGTEGVSCVTSASSRVQRTPPSPAAKRRREEDLELQS